MTALPLAAPVHLPVRGTRTDRLLLATGRALSLWALARMARRDRTRAASTGAPLHVQGDPTAWALWRAGVLPR